MQVNRRNIEVPLANLQKLLLIQLCKQLYFIRNKSIAQNVFLFRVVLFDWCIVYFHGVCLFYSETILLFCYYKFANV